MSAMGPIFGRMQLLFSSPLLTQQGIFRCVALSEAMGQKATSGLAIITNYVRPDF